MTAADANAENVRASQDRNAASPPPMHASTYQYLKPTDAQMADMSVVREAADNFARILEKYVPGGPDKTYLLRKFREVGMWANVAITRYPDGTPRI